MFRKLLSRLGRLPAVGLVLLGALAVLPMAGSAFSDATQERNVNRPGGDYRNFNVRADPDACRYECNNDRRCRAYTYVRPGVQGPSARCWLKDRVPAGRSDACCVSGVKTDPPRPPPGGGGGGGGGGLPGGLEAGTNRPGGDYNNFTSNNAYQCQAACAGDRRCAAFTWVRPGVQGPQGRCWLKSNIPRPVANGCCISGIQRPGGGTGGGGGGLEGNTNRRGGDFRNYTTTENAWACRQSCERDGRCRAFTWVRPGVQGPTARCWLKNTIPRATREDCCTSGVVR